MNSDKDIFKRTAEAFEVSDIKKHAEANEIEWMYSVSSTAFKQGAPVLIGFNWGAEQNIKYNAQVDFPEENFKDLYEKKWLGSFQRVYKPLKQYLPDEDIDNINQSNFCFFRSKTEDQISDFDLKLSEPLFREYIQKLNPSMIIGFSSQLRDYFISNNLISDKEEVRIQSNRSSIHCVKGNLVNSNTPIFFLPHPNAKFTNEAREKAWEFCFKPFSK